MSVVQAEVRGENTDHWANCTAKGLKVAPVVEQGVRQQTNA